MNTEHPSRHVGGPPRESHELKTVEDVKTWFTRLMQEENLIFHPDTPFCDYTKNYRQPVYSPAMATALDTAMDVAFTVCESAGVDIYKLAFDAFMETGGFSKEEYP